MAKIFNLLAELAIPIGYFNQVGMDNTYPVINETKITDC